MIVQGSQTARVRAALDTLGKLEMDSVAQLIDIGEPAVHLHMISGVAGALDILAAEGDAIPDYVLTPCLKAISYFAALGYAAELIRDEADRVITGRAA